MPDNPSAGKDAAARWDGPASFFRFPDRNKDKPYSEWLAEETAAGRPTKPGPQPMNAGITPGPNGHPQWQGHPWYGCPPRGHPEYRGEPPPGVADQPLADAPVTRAVIAALVGQTVVPLAARVEVSEARVELLFEQIFDVHKRLAPRPERGAA